MKNKILPSGFSCSTGTGKKGVGNYHNVIIDSGLYFHIIDLVFCILGR